MKITVKLDTNGILIGGEYKLLMVSSLFYFRIPKEQWENRMQTLISAGYNAIDVYFPWNYHEIKPNQWIFEGNRDIDTFLKLAKKNNLYVIARPGPYICSEWDGGGIPSWLYLEDIPIRQNDKRYLNRLQSWYEKVISMIRDHQITHDGSVILLQLENELDYYNCSQPAEYIEQLVQMAKNIGVNVPFIYCCGQDDIKGGGGEADNIFPAFNIYSEADDISLEERCLHLYKFVSEAGNPFLVTETNREHSYLKRLLSCGAKMISPYNQTASTTMDYYNAITNWGTKSMPLALLSSDYDFNSMIGSDGTLTREYIYARLFCGLINSFEKEIAAAKPRLCENEITIDKNSQKILPILTTEKGSFIPVTNFIKRKRKIKCKLSGYNTVVELEPWYTALLPLRLRVTSKAVIAWSNYEIAFVNHQGDITQVALYGYGELNLLIENNSKTNY